MLYTVKETSELANVTIKTLHYYHKIGLLYSCKVSEAGYRLYSTKELERLQEILFYRELDFSISKIKQLLDGKPNRLSILSEQKELLCARKKRLDRLVQTINESIVFTAKGDVMDHTSMFEGFHSEEEWEKAMEEQKQYLKENYDYDLFEGSSIPVEEMNETAAEAKRFMDGMAEALRAGLYVDDAKVHQLISEHLAFLTRHGHEIKPADFAAQSRFFLGDEFHRKMLEEQQTGLAYFLCLAAEHFASK
ncbi:MerR family transcriptional regulator [Aneurinibacillus sp. REN35]|uniref:MerR family transcriptional regulator n=1 Tax=Aneurinibacillus sp. REN35 TaxID=3237286 RepID=UPI0035287D52